MAWLFLLFAIAAEVTGTLSLRGLADAQPRWPLLLVTVVSYVVSFGLLALTLRHLGVGAVYAIWAGVGTGAVALLGWWLFGDRLNWGGGVGVLLIVTGVVVLVASGSAHSAAG
jgi:small multidrug resistance pump